MLVHTFKTVQNHFTLVIQFIQVIHLNEQVQILGLKVIYLQKE